MAIEIRTPLKPVDTTPLQAKKAVSEFLKSACGDRMLLLAVVAGGKRCWMQIAGKAFAGFKKHLKKTALEEMWFFMVREAGPDPVKQLALSEKAGFRKLKLEKIRQLSLMISSEAHLDEVLAVNIPDDDERVAVRHLMILMLQAQGIVGGATVH